MRLGKWCLVKHNFVTVGVFSDYNGQLHVSACTGHLQFVLGELNLRSYYKHSVASALLSVGPVQRDNGLGQFVERWGGGIAVSPSLLKAMKLSLQPHHYTSDRT